MLLTNENIQRHIIDLQVACVLNMWQKVKFILLYETHTKKKNYICEIDDNILIYWFDKKLYMLYIYMNMVRPKWWPPKVKKKKKLAQ